MLIKEKYQEDLYCLEKTGKYRSKHDKEKWKKEIDNNRKYVACGNSWPHEDGNSSCPEYGHHCKMCGKPNQSESKCKTQISQVNRIENLSDSDNSYIYKTNHMNKVSSKSMIKLRINNYDIDFQLMWYATMIPNKLKHFDLKNLNTKLFIYRLKTSLLIKDCFYSNIIFYDRIDYAKFYVISGKNKPENLLDIDDATSFGILEILSSVANEQILI